MLLSTLLDTFERLNDFKSEGTIQLTQDEVCVASCYQLVSFKNGAWMTRLSIFARML